MARRSHGCSYTASVDLVDTECGSCKQLCANLAKKLSKRRFELYSWRGISRNPMFLLHFLVWSPLRARMSASNVVGGVTYLIENPRMARIRTRPFQWTRWRAVLQCLLWATRVDFHSYLEGYGLQIFTRGTVFGNGRLNSKIIFAAIWLVFSWTVTYVLCNEHRYTQRQIKCLRSIFVLRSENGDKVGTKRYLNDTDMAGEKRRGSLSRRLLRSLGNSDCW